LLHGLPHCPEQSSKEMPVAKGDIEQPPCSAKRIATPQGQEKKALTGIGGPVLLSDEKGGQCGGLKTKCC